MREPLNYRYLNREGRWLDFRWWGLELAPGGVLRLQSLPRMVGGSPPGLATTGPPYAPAGVAVAHGDVYFTDPESHTLSVAEACDGTEHPVACLAGPGEFDTPRGLAYHAGRDALLLADAGNTRVLVIALPDLRITEIWDASGVLVEPVSLAVDFSGNVYVADRGAGTVLRLDALGRHVPDLRDAVTALGDLTPSEVAVGEVDGTEWLFVLDDGTGRVHVLSLEGHRHASWDTGLSQPNGLAALGGRVYVGDNDTRRLVAFTRSGERIGLAHGYEGPVAAVANDRCDYLFVAPGWGFAPLRLDVDGAFRRRGLMWGGPFANPSARSDPRHWIRARFAATEPDAHMQLFVLAQPAGTSAPVVVPDSDQPFADPPWRPVALDAPETLVGGAVGDELWLGLTFAGEGFTTPALEQIRVDFDHETLLQYLPALYVRDAASADVLARWLTLFQGTFEVTQAGIESLARLFDPAAAPAEWLPWLAGWLGLDLPDAWDEGRRRRAIAEAFARTSRRGTVDGLRIAIADEGGLEALIEEPIVQTGWWALADADASPSEAALSVLGVGTVLAAAEPQGAVAGTTAVLDGSFLAPQEEYARALFAEVAHRFTVRVYRGRSYSEAAVGAVRALLERERPAHTAYHLCVVEPRLRVGVQARVGVDAIVAGPLEPTRLDEAGETGLILGGEPAGRLGVGTSVGRVRLTETVIDS